MKRAMKWLKKLLTGRKDGDKDHKENHAASAGASGLPREKKRWSFVKQRKSGADGGSGRWPLVAGAAAAADLSQVRPCHCGEEAAAVVIQKAFRGYLARKALRALRSLVKLQALVRGYLVRRQTATTLHRLQAIVRLQASSHSVKKAYSWKSMEQERKIAQARINPPALPAHRRRLSDGADSNFERSPRIVEMDTCQLRSRSSRMTSRYASDSSDSPPAVAPPSPSPLPSKQPSRLSLRRCQEYEPRRSKTAHSTPRLGPVPSYDLPAKSAGAAADGLTRRLSHREGSPRYMAETTSSVAKMRCQSEPRQRPGAHTEGPAEPRPSLTRAGSRKSCSVVVQDSFSFKSSELSRMDRSEVSDEVTIDFYLDRLW